MFLEKLLIFLSVLIQLSQNVMSQSSLLSRSSASRLSSSRRSTRPVNTLIPEPYGPYYGLTLGTRTAARLPIPVSAAGSCRKGATYRIKNPGDFRKYEQELQCVFNAASAPSKVPEGVYFGRALLVLNARHFILNPLINSMWRGNFVYRVQCHRNSTEESYIGFHNTLGRAVIPYFMYVAPLKENFAPGEHEDGKPSAIMDLTQDFSRVCPNYGDYVEKNRATLPVHVKRLANVYPFTQVHDAIRLVGRQSDGGLILLGKTYLRDYYRRDKQSATIAFWYAVNYDEGVSPEFQVEQALPPLEEEFRYTFPGVVDIVKRYLPIDNFLSRPMSTLLKFQRGVWNTARNSLINFREFYRNIGSLRANSRRYNDIIRDARPRKDYRS